MVDSHSKQDRRTPRARGRSAEGGSGKKSRGRKPAASLNNVDVSGIIGKVRDGANAVADTGRKATRKTREFASVEHLSAEAVTAFVDEELAPIAMHRARIHLVHCQECREEINRQRGASEWLRDGCSTDEVRAPKDLKAKLAGLADTCPEGPGDEDLTMRRPDSLVAKVESVVRAVRRVQQDRQ